MELRSARVRDFRSIFGDERGQDLVVDLGSGMNTFVGRNNCGKSNVTRAIALALDPNLPFRSMNDTPGPRPFAYPVVTLTFEASGASPEEEALLAAARAYEQAVDPLGRSFADERRVILEVSFPPTPDGDHRRTEVLQTSGGARPATADQHKLLTDALEKLRETVRFVMISSGESIQSVLEGNFREILHNVIQERLHDHFDAAEEARQAFIHGLQDELLAPLRDRLVGIVHDLFPEIDAVTLAPDVSSIDTALSNVTVSLRDVVDTPLTLKGTGVRGGVLVAMLRYLADNATRGMVFALEEPEAFLHPAAQEDLRDELEALARRDDVTLLVTTHSPFVISRVPEGRVFALTKDRAGRTCVSVTARGDEPHAPLVGGLFRDVTFEELLRQSTEVAPGAKAILLVEGDGDRRYLELVCERAQRPELIEDIHVKAAGGCRHIVAQAVIARAASGDLPVGVLLDNDEFGRLARKDLTTKFEFKNKTEVVSYAAAFDSDHNDHAWEAEDLFPPELIEAFIAEHGAGVTIGSWKRPDGRFHYDFDSSAKEMLHEHLEQSLLPHHLDRWIALIEQIRSGLGLPIPDTSDTGEGDGSGNERPPEIIGIDVLVLADKAAHARYEVSQAAILDPDRPLDASITHVAFYAGGAVQREIPAVRARYPSLRFDESSIAQLRSTDKPNDVRASDLIAEWLAEGEVKSGDVHQLVLLASADAADTLVLGHEITNTKTTEGGKPLAWVVGQRVVPFAALASGAATTDEVDDVLTGNTA